MQLALARARAGSQPLQREDGFKLGLVVEGGGMRGAVSAGSLMAIEQLGLKCARALVPPSPIDRAPVRALALETYQCIPGGFSLARLGSKVFSHSAPQQLSSGSSACV